MKILKPVSGVLTVEFTGAVPEQTLDKIAAGNIPISNIVQKSDLTYEMQIRRCDYRHLAGILSRRGDHFQITGKRGIYYLWAAWIHRPILVGVFLLLLMASFYLPSKIFFISVEGNRNVSDRQILTAAQDCGIRFAASRKLVRSEKVKNALLSAVPQLQWAGVNTSGCTAVISVREREEESAAERNTVSNLVADRDGYILSCTVTSGTAHCLPGQTVTKGQLLISGYTDCGFCIRASRAEGEILAQTRRQIQALLPKEYLIPEAKEDIRFMISLLIGKKRINLWKSSRIFSGVCGRMYEEYYVSLPGGFQLPVAVCIDRYIPYTLRKAAISEADAKEKLQQFSKDYLIGQMIAGQVIRKQQTLSDFDGQYLMKSNYVCTEIIGKEQREQIGDFNGKGN